jgi:hypothetical protein
VWLLGPLAAFNARQSTWSRNATGEVMSISMWSPHGAHCNHTRHKRKRPPEPASYLAEIRRRVGRGGRHHPWVKRLGLLRAD